MHAPPCVSVTGGIVCGRQQQRRETHAACPCDSMHVTVTCHPVATCWYDTLSRAASTVILFVEGPHWHTMRCVKRHGKSARCAHHATLACMAAATSRDDLQAAAAAKMLWSRQGRQLKGACASEAMSIWWEKCDAET